MGQILKILCALTWHRKFWNGGSFIYHIALNLDTNLILCGYFMQSMSLIIDYFLSEDEDGSNSEIYYRNINQTNVDKVLPFLLYIYIYDGLYETIYK